MFDKDSISKRANQVLDILFLRQPLRTVFGLLIGFLFFTFVYTFRKLIESSWFEVDKVHYTACFVSGLLIVHAKTFLDAYRGTALDEEINTLLNVVNNNTDLSKEQKKLMVAEILHKEISKLGQKELKQVSDNVTEE
ncbi:hypothetical protein I4X51_004034 [Salmonella enterica subsp. enterica serovar Agona]|nr:hypothetical protein [Salmonella enterica subsp. enterica serovar Agona]